MNDDEKLIGAFTRRHLSALAFGGDPFRETDYSLGVKRLEALKAERDSARADLAEALKALQIVMQHGRIDDSETRMNMVGAILSKHQKPGGGAT